jgi:3-methyladenine DNA glycosylase AlkC
VAIKIILDSFRSKSPLIYQNDEMKGAEVFYYMPHGGYVAKYGLDYYDESMQALLEITKRFTAEFSIRPFIQKYPEKIFPQLMQWTEHENQHVRRLVSEGTRPRLPWASWLKEVQQDPLQVLKLLDKLKEDPELYVRRSVANNLNDIAKDHPDTVVELLESWKKIANPKTQWIIKHAMRSLVKTGHHGALNLLGYNPAVKVKTKLSCRQQQIKVGESLSFEIEINSFENKSIDLMIDYQLYFMKSNKKQSAKVFKLTKKTLEAGEQLLLTKKHSFKVITTRKYYPGQHSIGLIINGLEYAKIDFNLKN